MSRDQASGGKNVNFGSVMPMFAKVKPVGSGGSAVWKIAWETAMMARLAAAEISLEMEATAEVGLIVAVPVGAKSSVIEDPSEFDGSVHIPQQDPPHSAGYCHQVSFISETMSNYPQKNRGQQQQSPVPGPVQF